jgi:nucleotide-binding universal stress UspA family protein
LTADLSSGDEMEQSMNSTSSPARVVVGIDGSQAAVHAALWAIEEAVSRDVPLRLVTSLPRTSKTVQRNSAARGRPPDTRPTRMRREHARRARR